jgi:hypothetical protein
MSSVVRTLSGILVAVVATGLGALAIAADAPPRATPAAMQPADMAQRHQQMLQRHLDAAAARLEIKASQQAAWQAYAAAVKQLVDVAGMPPRPDADADAATIARQRAARATTFAQRLETIADATAKLQSVLSPEQKGVLTEITRNAGMHAGFGGPMQHERGMHRGWHDGPAGQGRGPMGSGDMGSGPMGGEQGKTND